MRTQIKKTHSGKNTSLIIWNQHGKRWKLYYLSTTEEINVLTKKCCILMKPWLQRTAKPTFQILSHFKDKSTNILWKKSKAVEEYLPWRRLKPSNFKPFSGVTKRRGGCVCVWGGGVIGEMISHLKWCRKNQLLLQRWIVTPHCLLYRLRSRSNVIL